MRHLKIWICTVVIVLASIIYLSVNKMDSYSFDEIINDESLTIHLMENYIDQISGIYNNWNVYNDFLINDYADLLEVSDYVYCVKIESLSQFEDAIFTGATITSVIKDKDSLYEIDDTITFLQMNKITYNENNNNFTMQMYSPCLITEKTKEYIVFLNKIDEYKNVFRTSTICYSIVPIISEIKILRYDEEDFEYINKTKYSLFYKLYKEFHYVITNFDDSKFLNDIEFYDNELEKDILMSSFEKEKVRGYVYSEIVQKSLEKIDFESQIKIVDF